MAVLVYDAGKSALREFSGPKTGEQVSLFGFTLRSFMDFYKFLVQKGYSEEVAHKWAAEFSEFQAEHGSPRPDQIGTVAPEERPLPEQAPAKWAEHRKPRETPPAFIQRNYSAWLGKGLGRSDIRQLDPKLYMALNNWLRHNHLPEDFGLPTVLEQSASWREKFSAAEASGSALTLPADPKAMHRLASVIERGKERGRN